MAKTNQFTQDQMIDAIVKSHGLVSFAAKLLSCNHQTVTNYAAKYPAVKAALDEQRSVIVDKAESALITALDKGEAWAIALTLKTLGKSRGYVERQEVENSGPGGAPLKTYVVTVHWDPESA